jgi:hypothetical protein
MDMKLIPGDLVVVAKGADDGDTYLKWTYLMSCFIFIDFITW